MNSKEALISVRNAGVRYKSARSLFRQQYRTALHDVSFELNAGDSLGILGRNGAGKSTLLRLLAGVVEPDTGVVDRRATCALLALQVGFDPQLDGYTNVMLSGLLMGFSKPEVRARITDIVDFSELGDAMRQPIKVYSAGMRARLGFSVAVHLHSDVLLIDEVLGVGDAEFRAKSSKFIRSRIQSDSTVVLVSHNAAIIKQLCNRAVWIENGVTHRDGSATEVVDEYEAYVLQNKVATSARHETES